MSETQALYTVGVVAILTWGALFIYLITVDRAVRRLEHRR